MMKRFALVLLTAGLLTVSVAAQTQEPVPNSTTSGNTATTKHRHHHHKGLKQYSSDPRVQELEAKQKAERAACKANRSSADCANLKSREKAERKALMRELRGEQGLGNKKKNG